VELGYHGGGLEMGNEDERGGYNDEDRDRPLYSEDDYFDQTIMLLRTFNEGLACEQKSCHSPRFRAPLVVEQKMEWLTQL